MKDTGLLGMMLPEAYGGIGLDMLDRAVIYEELRPRAGPGAVLRQLGNERAGDPQGWQPGTEGGAAAGDRPGEA
jgi:alkylation response protein AidB-like acyl-CoA dehydrogenase